jgi:hypothetical protein
MTSIRAKFLAALAAIGLMLGMALTAGAGPAFASTYTVCENGSGPYGGPLLCLNDWSGSGTVKMYADGSSYEDFTLQIINRCYADGVITPNCSSLSPVIDADYNDGGGTTVQILYNPTGQCLALNAELSNCNNTGSGTGGATGTVFVLSNSTNQIMSNYYTGEYGFVVGLYGENSSGGTVNEGQSNPSTWDGTLT